MYVCMYVASSAVSLEGEDTETMGEDMEEEIPWEGECIERFHSLGQHLCKFIGTKESVCRRKEFNSHRIDLGHQLGRRFIGLGHPYGPRDVM